MIVAVFRLVDVAVHYERLKFFRDKALNWLLKRLGALH
jgi:hypothetical protein